jgi:hypothetical protein
MTRFKDFTVMKMCAVAFFVLTRCGLYVFSEERNPSTFRVEITRFSEVLLTIHLQIIWTYNPKNMILRN